MTDNTLPDVDASYAVLVRRAHDELGGRAPLDAVMQRVQSEHPDRWETETFSAMKSATRSALTEHDSSAMPFASSVGDDYVQRRLFVPDDYATTIERYVEQSGSLLATAQRLADECLERYGIRFDVPAHAESTRA